MNRGLFVLALLWSLSFAADEISRISDPKAFKKLLKSRSNVLVMFMNDEDKAIVAEFTLAANKLKGKGTFALVRCKESKTAKKVCEGNIGNQKIVLKHYKDGEEHKEYNRPIKLKSLENFMLDPESEPSWDEDETAENVFHATDATLDQVIAKGEPTLVMFYAPWCGHCKKMKPDYAAAATELKGKAVLVAIDTTSPKSRVSVSKHQIKGYPTVKYFEKGEFKYDFGNDRTKKGILDFIANPGPPPPPPPPELEWSQTESFVNHLAEDNFTSFVSANPSTLVMFYAPWCGHCKAAKPEIQSAAEILKNENINGALAAVDATKYPSIAKDYDVSGYPTFWYFKDGQKAFQYNLGRKKDDFISFLKDPKEPPPPPPPEPSWSDTPSQIVHLTDDNFHQSIKSKKHAMVMFYAPWCGHCKAFKPTYHDIAEALKDNKKVRIAAVDCTLHTKVCTEFSVNGYPAIKYFSGGKFVEDYTLERTKESVITFLTNKGLKTEL